MEILVMESIHVQVLVIRKKLTNCGKFNGFSLIQYQRQQKHNRILIQFQNVSTIYVSIFTEVYEVCSKNIRIGIVVVVHWVGCVCSQS